jgi:Polyketide cyclase / dehydrase and lipid transport
VKGREWIGDTARVDVHAALEAPCPPDELFVFVDDLGRYPAWVDLVHRAEPVVADDGAHEWQIELRARIGPFARSKQLRMRRTVHDPDAHVAVFERREVDGRSHSPWVLRAEVTPTAEGSALQMHLHYGGGLWTGGVLERALADQITNGRERLLNLVRSTH